MNAFTHRGFVCLSTLAWLLTAARAQSPLLTFDGFSPGGITLSWPESVHDYQLEESATLGPPVVWSPVNDRASPVGTRLQVVLPNIGIRRFFQLRYATPQSPQPFNTGINFNLAMENAASPSCGCDGEAPYSQGISLTAERCADCEGGVTLPGIAQDTGGGQVFLHSGEFVHRAVDLEISSRGFNWRMERVYRSGITFDGPLGRNWEFSHNRRLVVETNGNILRMDGSGRADRYLAKTDGSYSAPRGFYTKLLRNPNGSFTERDRHGAIVEYSAPGADHTARMTAVRDRNGNTMRFEYDVANRLVRAFDTFGRRMDYRYTGGRLSEVEDFTGRIVTYQYNAVGDLISVTSPAVTGTPHANDFPAGKTARYNYSSGFGDERLNHNLLAITAPNEVAAGGPPRVILGYDTNAFSPDVDRLLSLMMGGTNASGVPAGGTILYQYQSLGSAASTDFATAVFQTTVTDRAGNLADYQFNQIGNIVRLREYSNRGVRSSDPASFETRADYSEQGEMTRAIHPEGNSVEFTYDSANPDRFQQGNLLQLRRLPDGTRPSDQAQLVRSHAYEPLYNKMHTMTDPRGFTTTHRYDYQESATAPATAAQFGIAIPPELLGLGDLNGDSRTDQAGGNLVRRDDPTVSLLPGSNQAMVEGGAAQEITRRFTWNNLGQLTRIEDPRGNLHLISYYPENDPDGDGADVIAGRNGTTGGYQAQAVRDALAGPNRQDPLPAVAITTHFQLDRRGNPIAVTDGRGFVTRFTYNVLDQIVQEEKPKVNPGQATGYLRRYHYDANDNRTGTDIQNVTTDPATHLPLVVASHPFFQHRSTFDILDRRVEDRRDAARDPSIAASGQPELLTTQFRYDANGNLMRTLSPLAVGGAEPNNFESFTFDERDLHYTITRGGASAQASTSAFDFDRNRNPARWTDAEDNDASAGPESGTTLYDGFDRRHVVIDRAGNERRFTLDPAGQVVGVDFIGRATGTSMTNVLLTRRASRYDEADRRFQADRTIFLPAGVTPQIVTPLTDGPLTPGDGQVSERREFDALGRMTFRVEDDNAVYRFEYDGAGRRIRETLPLVDTVTPGGPFPTKTDYAYDGNNNVVRRTEIHTSPEGIVSPAVLPHVYVYDALNRLVRATDPLGQTSCIEYDSRDNVVATYDARGASVPDPLGLYTADNINDRGNVTRYAYDGVGRRWREVRELTTTGNGDAPRDLSNPFNPDGLVIVQTEFDANSRIVSRTDDAANRTAYSYDVLNRLVTQTNADGGLRTWQYDRDDNQTSMRDENNTLHTFVHDGLNRLVTHLLAPDLSKLNAAGLPLLVGTTQQSFQYDGLSRPVQCTDNNDPADLTDDWTVELKYDSLNRLVEEVQNGRAVSSGYVSDDRTELHYPGAGRVVHLTWDAHDQFKGLSNFTTVNILLNLLVAPCPPISYSFAAANLPPSLTVTQGVNANKLVTQIQQTSSTLGQIGGHFLSRNRNNDVISAFRMAGNGAETINQNMALELDSLDRQSLFASQIQTPSGNTDLTRQQTFSGAQDVPLVRDDQNQPVQQLNFSPTHEPMNAFLLHNASPGTGIRTRDANFIYQWDGLNRLRVVRQRTSPSTIVARYNYDACPAIHGGRRVQKTAGGGITRFYYDGPNCIEETLPASGLPERVIRQFLFGSRADEVLAMDADTNNDGNPDQLSFYLYDHNNNVTQLVDAGGQPVEFYFYDFRGRPLIYDAATLTSRTNSPRGNPWLFTGQRHDFETGLHYCKARYHDPIYGVFLSRDPLGMWADRNNAGNGMALVANNPWNRRDPTGLEDNPWLEGLDVISDWLFGDDEPAAPPPTPPPAPKSDKEVLDYLEKRNKCVAALKGLEGAGEKLAEIYVEAGKSAATALPFGWILAEVWKIAAGQQKPEEALKALAEKYGADKLNELGDNLKEMGTDKMKDALSKKLGADKAGELMDGLGEVKEAYDKAEAAKKEMEERSKGSESKEEEK